MSAVEDAIEGNKDLLKAKENLTRDEFKNQGWKDNCGNSVLNFVLRRKGIDCTALPLNELDGTGGMGMQDFLGYFKGAKKHSEPKFSFSGEKSLDNYKSQLAKHILENISDGQDGACGAIRLHTPNDEGHFIAWYNDKGAIKFFDTQPCKDNADSQFTKIVKGSLSEEIEITTRLDNVEIRTDKILNSKNPDAPFHTKKSPFAK